jgi:uncharacterized protein YjdB
VLLVGAVIIAALVAIGVFTALPQTVDGYRSAAVSACQEALAAVRTAQLVGQAEADGQSLSTYSARAVTDALDQASTAVGNITAEETPDSAAALRNHAVALTVAAATRVADIQTALSAGDIDRLRAHLRAAAATGQQLDDFVRRNQ